MKHYDAQIKDTLLDKQGVDFTSSFGKKNNVANYLQGTKTTKQLTCGPHHFLDLVVHLSKLYGTQLIILPLFICFWAESAQLHRSPYSYLPFTYKNRAGAGAAATPLVSLPHKCVCAGERANSGGRDDSIQFNAGVEARVGITTLPPL